MHGTDCCLQFILQFLFRVCSGALNNLQDVREDDDDDDEDVTESKSTAEKTATNNKNQKKEM